MRVQRLYVLIASLAAVLATCSCHSAKKPVALLSPKQARPPAMVVPTQAPTPAPPELIPQPSASDTTQAAKADPVDALIAKVEKEYQAGQENYKAGRQDEARKNFDRAFDLLLSSNLDVNSDPRLEREFDRVLETYNSFEMVGLRPAEGSSEQKSEPAPIDEANEVTYPVDANIKAKAEAEIQSTRSDLPLMMTDQVAGYINYFSTPHGRTVLENALIRSGRYDQMIRKTLKDEGVPQDLIYLAQAESGFHPLALSRVGARGIWQFMASRGRGYGLQRSLWVDERQDPEKATRAAARHLKDLYQQFGDWYLAMAAYNSGPGTVQSAVKRTGYADFWELYRRNVLPKETRNYVPIIVAVTIMAKNPTQYGLDRLEREKPVPYDIITLDKPVDLRLVAECIEVSPSELQELNPSLLRMTTPQAPGFKLHLPAGTREKFETAIAVIPPEMRVWWRYHKVVPGDTLSSLARVYRSTPNAIAEANHLEVSEALVAESKLAIPIVPGKHSTTEDGATYARHATRYRIRKGDTVQSVADNFGVPPAMVRRWNRLKGDSLRGRSAVYVHLPITPNADRVARASNSPKSRQKKAVQAAQSSKNPTVHHKVKQGETLYSIASVYKTTVDALKRDNRNVATLRPGMVLVIR